MDVYWGSLDMDNNGKVAILDEISKSMMGIEVPDNDCLMSQLVIYLIMLRIACQGYKRIILLLVRDINFLKRCFCCNRGSLLWWDYFTGIAKCDYKMFAFAPNFAQNKTLYFRKVFS
jgi:hypothetical protein